MDPFDTELKQKMRNWANQQAPPTNGRARLMGAAASRIRPGERSSHAHLSSFPVDLYSWVMVYSMKRGVAALKIVS
jgi:hypothetical protein